LRAKERDGAKRDDGNQIKQRPRNDPAGTSIEIHGQRLPELRRDFVGRDPSPRIVANTRPPATPAPSFSTRGGRFCFGGAAGRQAEN